MIQCSSTIKKKKTDLLHKKKIHDINRDLLIRFKKTNKKYHIVKKNKLKFFENPETVVRKTFDLESHVNVTKFTCVTYLEY